MTSIYPEISKQTAPVPGHEAFVCLLIYVNVSALRPRGALVSGLLIAIYDPVSAPWTSKEIA